MIQPVILRLVFNHIVLPPQLPGENDDSAEDVERDLTRRMTDAVKTLRSNSDSDTTAVWQSIEESLQALHSITEDSHIKKVSLLSCFTRAAARPCHYSTHSTAKCRSPDSAATVSHPNSSFHWGRFYCLTTIQR